ncbi:MAG: Ig-like domain-containing protein [Cyclobacteriaceae bacterium]
MRTLLLISLLAYGGYSYAQSLDSFTLMNADTNEPIQTIEDGDEFDIADTGTSLNIRANTSGTIGSVKFDLDGTTQRTEGVAPYAMAGDNSGDYNVWTPSLGEHTLVATAHTDGGAGGDLIGTLSVSFTFKETVEPIEIPTETGTGEVNVSGELKQWHKVTLDFDGPNYAETDNDPNPFLDFRLDVTFTKGDKSYVVPGYFAADGDAGESSATAGNVWRVHFSPNETGSWTYSASFRIGRNIATSDDDLAGDAVTPIDGKTGTITIAESDKSGKDLRGKGRLKYVGKHHLQFEGNQEYFIKGGADAPENFLAYDEFDGEFKSDGIKDDLVKDWDPHIQDWNEGDPTWKSSNGKGIIGAVNYLSESGLNVFSFLTMNISGDDANVYPYVSSSDLKHIDCSKVDQWELVFSHAEEMGMYLHFKTQETENDQLLDGGDVGRNRKLYYRELIARFGHHLALNWNLGEENTQTVQQRKDMAQYFFDHDPYQNHIVIHSFPDQQSQVYPSLLGDASKLTGASVQTNWNNVYRDTKKWVDESAKENKPWVVANDEQGSANTGVPDDTYTGSPSLDQIRQQTLWGNLMAGGAGVEYYFGYQLPHSDLSLEDYRSRATSWTYVSHALEFFRAHVPFYDMKSNNDLVADNAWCLAQGGEVYLVYLPGGGSTSIDLTGAGAVFNVQWFDPTSGGDLQDGSVTLVAGTGSVDLGSAPSNSDQDWAVLLTKGDDSLIDEPLPVIQASVLSGPAPLEVTFDASASKDNGTIETYSWDFGGDTPETGSEVTHTFNDLGENTVVLTVTDNENKQSTASIVITVKADNPTAGCGSAETWLSAELPLEGSDFYIDNFTGTSLLAITPDETSGTPATATVSQEFEGDNCNYNITFHGVGESDGQAEFKVFVNDTQLGSDIILPLSTQSWEMGSLFNTTFEDIALANGDIIKVEGKTASADGQEWSRARWLKLEIEPVACSGNVFAENDGYVVVEAESIELNDSWTVTNSFSVDALGEGHIEYNGSNSYGSVPQHSIIEYNIEITTTGVYQFKWRSRNGKTAQAFDQDNDSWLKIEADEFYGLKGTNKTDIGNHFSKVWIQDLNNWSWNCFGEHGGVNGMNVYARFDNPGTYKISIAGRSKNHPIDRFVLYQSGKGSIAMNLDTEASGTDCGSSTAPKDYASPANFQGRFFKTPILIDDAEDDSWSFIQPVKGESESAGKDLPAEDDLSFSFKAGYDATYLYVYAEVKDDEISGITGDATDFGNWDNVEIYINEDGKHNDDGAYGDDAVMIRMNYGVSDHSFTGTGSLLESNATNFENLEFQFTDITGGYILEARMPWAGLVESGSVSAGKELGFDIAVSDRDSGTGLENHVSWANDTKNNTAYQDTRKFGTLVLEEELPDFPKKTDWSIIYSDSESEGGTPAMTIDGDPNTFWHTEWKDAQPLLPHELHIDMAKNYDIAEVHYMHRQDQWGPNGAIGEYEIYVSFDPNDWGDPAAAGELTWPENLADNYKMSHKIELDKVARGRYLRLVALTETQEDPDKPFTAVAELDIVEGELDESEIVAVSEITIDGGQTLEVDETLQLTKTISPSNATNRLVVWSVADESIVSIDQNGLLTAKGIGSTVVKATAQDDSGVIGELDISVVDKIIAVTQITVSGESSTTVGEKLQLTATIAPTDATEQSVTWTVSDESIATIDENGLLTGVAAGTVTVLAEAKDASKISGELEITISAPLALSPSTENKLSVYPNPATNKIKIKGLDESSEAKIYDVSGSLMFSQKIRPLSSKINIERLSRGVYIIHIVGSDSLVQKLRIIKG